jgi:hypothetical protein
MLITHENLTHFHMPQVIENTDCDKPCADRGITSRGTDKGIITKYAATENHVTGKPTVLKQWKISSARPNISVAHEEVFIKHTDRDKPRIEGVTTSMGTDKEKPSTRSKISLAHEESSTAIPELSSARSIFLIAHESKYTGRNTKYATTATEQSSTPTNNDNPTNNSKRFYSQYLQTVL